MIPNISAFYRSIALAMKLKKSFILITKQLHLFLILCIEPLQRMKTICIISMLFCVLNLNSQSQHQLLRKGDTHYDGQNFSEAEVYYKKSLEKDSDLKSNYNLGNAVYQQERFEEAIEHYESATSKAKTKEEESSAFYNLGNAYFQNQKLQEAVNAYKQSIRINPNNEDARHNLGMAKQVLRMMQQQQQQQQQQSDSDENQDQDQENQDQENQDQDQQQQENQQQENQDQSDQQNNSEEEQEQEEEPSQQMEENQFDSTRLQKQNLDSLDAAKLLQIIKSEEQKVQEKLRKFSSKRKKPDKDW